MGPMPIAQATTSSPKAWAELMSITGERDDLPGGGPQKVGVAIADITTGMYAAVAILAALNHRHASGRGQHLDCNLLDTQVAMLANLSLNYLVSGKVPKRAGNAHQNIMPYNVFRVADGHIILAIGNDAQFAGFCKLTGQSVMAEDPRYATNADRVRNRDALTKELAGILAGEASAPGRNCSTQPAYPADRFMTCRKSLPIGTSLPAKCNGKWSTRSPTRFPRSRIRCAIPRPTPTIACRPRCWDNTRSRCCGRFLGLSAEDVRAADAAGSHRQRDAGRGGGGGGSHGLTGNVRSGGVLAALFKDTAMRPHPPHGKLSREDAQEMARELEDLAAASTVSALPQGRCRVPGFRHRRPLPHDAASGQPPDRSRIDTLFVLPEGQGARAADGVVVLGA